MVRYLHVIYFVLLMFVVSSFSVLEAQERIDYTAKNGLKYIKIEDYQSAQEVYSHLLRKYPKDGAYNFYMGICLLNNKGDLSQTIKRLNYAKLKKVSRKVYYYLGRAHQLSFHFDEAISNFNRFLQYASKGDDKIEKTKLYLEQCDNSRKISSKIYDLNVVNKTKLLKSKVLDKYRPAKDVGKLYNNRDFFESGVNPDNIMFETERGDVVYFSMPASTEDSSSIFKMVKLLDGWGESVNVGEPVNSVYNDAYPFLETDGLSFYFSSDRPGGFGGFDIYKVYFDNETQSFLEPINVGVPFNSPFDDFLFVSDEFRKVAWFTSNRETRGDTVMVYKVKWDGTQVRNMVEDINQISASAKLAIGGVGNGLDNNDNGSSYKDEKSKRKKKGKFNFEINDTIVYTEFSHFINADALVLFKDGYNKEQQMDSLASLMKSMRYKYAAINNEVEKNKIVNKILNLENRVYSLEDQIQEKYLYARQKELYEIKDRIKQGNYDTTRSADLGESKALNFDGIFIPEKYSLHTSDEFERHFSQQKEMYETLFTSNDIETLRYADSLYVWANILNLESSRLLEASTKGEEAEHISLGKLIKKVDSLRDKDEELTPSNMIKESKQLKILSTRIYHKALDKKFPIYYLKLKDVSRKLNEADAEAILMFSQQGNAYFREAKEILNMPGGLDIETFEKAGTVKRAGIEKQEKALRLYSNLGSNAKNKNIGNQKKKVTGVVQKSYAEIHRGAEVVKPKKNVVAPPKKEVKDKANEEQGEKIFKIQIGVFKNPPKQEAVNKIPTVSKIELKGRGLTKYFAGSYKTYKEAQSKIPEVIDAGFSGAFVVFFENGKMRSIPQK